MQVKFIKPVWRRFEFLKDYGLCLEVGQFGEYGASLVLCLVFGRFYIPLPFRITGWDSFKCPCPSWGFDWKFKGYRGSLFLSWGERSKIISMPWKWEHVRHDVLMQDGTWKRVREGAALTLDGRMHPDSAPWDWKDKHQEAHPYRYTLKNGKVQERTATIGVEEREWRWRWFTWLPWPRMVHRAIDVQFSDEVGERSGSWKGGCVGCSYDMIPGEKPADTLKRMERERIFT